MSVYYKFKSALTYDSVQFNELSISLEEFKKLVIEKKQFGKNTNFDLSVTNAETNEVYTDDQTLIPKNSSLIVVRVPLIQQRNKNNNWNNGDNTFQKNVTAGDEDIESKKAFLKVSDLSNCNVSEQDKIEAMMYQSTIEYDPAKYVRLRGSNQHGEPPVGYTCHKCRLTGHWIQDCPAGPGDIKKSSGIPQDFMTPVDGPQVPGALMTPDGSFAVRTIDVEAQKTKTSSGQLEVTEKPTIPEDLLCSLCQDLLTEAIMMPCCGDSFCDECIRNALLESEDNQCPECKEKDVSPETLIPNRFLRNSVNSFQNETGYYGQRVKQHSQKQLTNATEDVLTGQDTRNSVLSEQQTKQIKIENSAAYMTKNDHQRNFQRVPISQDPLIIIDRQMTGTEKMQQGRVNVIHSINDLRQSDQHVPFASDFNRAIAPIVYGPPPTTGIVHNFSVPPPLRQNIPTHHTVMPVFQQLPAPRQIQPIYSIQPLSIDGRNFRLRARHPGPGLGPGPGGVMMPPHRYNAAVPITDVRVIDDPLEAFQRHLREKDRRDQLRRARRRSRSVSRGRSHSRIRSKRRSRSNSLLRGRNKSRSPVNINKTRSKSGTASRSRSRSTSVTEYHRRSKSRSPIQSAPVPKNNTNINNNNNNKRKRTRSKSPVPCSPKNGSRSKSYNSGSPVGNSNSNSNRRSHSRSRSPRDYHHSPMSNNYHHYHRSSKRSSYKDHYNRRDNSVENNYADDYWSNSRSNNSNRSKSRSSRYHNNHNNHHSHNHHDHHRSNVNSNVRYRSPAASNRYADNPSSSTSHSNYHHSHSNRYKYGNRSRHDDKSALGARSDVTDYQENVTRYEQPPPIDSGAKYTRTTTYETAAYSYNNDNNEWEAADNPSYDYEAKKSAQFHDYGYSSPGQGQDKSASYYKGSNKSPNKDSHRRHRDADDKKYKTTYDEVASHDDHNVGYNKNRVLVDLKRESSPEPEEKPKKDKKHEESKENKKEKSKRKKKREKDSDVEKKKRKKDKEEIDKKEHIMDEDTSEKREDTSNVEETSSLPEKCDFGVTANKDIPINDEEKEIEEGNEDDENENENVKETSKKEEKDVLAVIPPELSKWERDEAIANTDEIIASNDGSNTREEGKTTVTSEILKRAENALFLKSVKCLGALNGGKSEVAIEEEINNTSREAKRSGNSIQITVGAPSRSPDNKPVPGTIYSEQTATTTSHRLSAKERLGAKIQVSDQAQPIVKSTVVAKNKSSPSRTLKSIVGVRRGYSDKNSSSSSYSRHRRSEERFGSNREREHGRSNVADMVIRDKDSNRGSRWERSRSREKRNDRNDNKRERRHNSEEQVKSTSSKKDKSKHSSNHSSSKHKDNNDDSKPSSTVDEKNEDNKKSKDSNEDIKKLPLDEANFEPDYDMACGVDEVAEKTSSKKTGNASETSDSQSASDSSSDTSTERKKKKKKKERKRKHRHVKKKKSDSSEGSCDESGSDDSKHKHRRKHKHKKKSKKKKRSKQVK